MNVPEGRDPEDYILDIEGYCLADDLIEKAQTDALTQYCLGDGEYREIFIGSDECNRSYDWFNCGSSETECEVVEDEVEHES